MRPTWPTSPSRLISRDRWPIWPPAGTSASSTTASSGFFDDPRSLAISSPASFRSSRGAMRFRPLACRATAGNHRRKRAIVRRPTEPADNIAVKVEQFKHNFVRLSVVAPHPGFVYMSESFLPGWTATVNGQRRADSARELCLQSRGCARRPRRRSSQLRAAWTCTGTGDRRSRLADRCDAAGTRTSSSARITTSRSRAGRERDAFPSLIANEGCVRAGDRPSGRWVTAAGTCATRRPSPEDRRSRSGSRAPDGRLQPTRSTR